jgi:hypothetical protein
MNSLLSRENLILCNIAKKERRRRYSAMVMLSSFRNNMIGERNARIIQGVMLLWIMICLCLAIFAKDVLPPKYLFDAGNIASRFGYVNRFTIGQSYDNTALFYEVILLSQSQHLASVVFSTTFFVFSLKCTAVPRFLNWGALHSLLLFAFACMAGAVYLGQYSKESTSLLLVMAFMLISGTVGGRLIWIVIACFYAAYFRPYWAIVLGFYIIFRFVIKYAKSLGGLLLSIILTLFILALAFKLLLGIDLAFYRYVVNDTRTYDVSANTLIKPLLPVGGVFLGWCNGVMQLFLMFFPISLISANPLYLAFFVIMASLGIRLVLMLRDLVNIPAALRQSKQTECLALLMAFVTVQSIFEPDYGSYIRHLMPMLPVALFFCSRGLGFDLDWRDDHGENK